jgi:hypothetical protein
MSKWREAGLMETVDDGFELYDPDELEEIAGSVDEDVSLPVMWGV